MIRNSEQKIVLLRSYRMENVIKQLVKKSSLAAKQIEMRHGIYSIWSFMTFCDRECLHFYSLVVNLLAFQDACSCLPATSKMLCAGERSGDLAFCGSTSYPWTQRLGASHGICKSVVMMINGTCAISQHKQCIRL